MEFPVKNLRVAIAQMTSTDDVAQNEGQIKELLARATHEKPDIVCFPENSLYMKIKRSETSASFDLSEPFFHELKEWCEQTQASILLGSLPYRDQEGRVHNATIWVRADQDPEVVYKKIHLFDVDVEGEKAVRESDQFQHGSEARLLEVKGWKLGLSICYDLRFSELYSRYRDQAHALLVPSAFLVPTGRAHWHVLLRARAIEFQCYVIAAAQAGRHLGKSEGERETFGHSLAVDPWGEVLVDLTTPGPEVQVVELDVERLKKVRKQIPMHQHRRI